MHFLSVIVKAIQRLPIKSALVKDNSVIAYVTENPSIAYSSDDYDLVTFSGEVVRIRHPWDIFSKNDVAIRMDYDLLTKGRESQPISSTNTVIGEAIFMEEGATVEASILNATTGPIYIGKHAQIMEGSIVRGALALCDHAILKMGSKIYGASTFGPYCKVGAKSVTLYCSPIPIKGMRAFWVIPFWGSGATLGRIPTPLI